MIVTLAKLELVDEYQLGMHPAIASGGGLALFKDIVDGSDLKQIKTKTFDCGAVTLYYEPTAAHR